MPKKFKAKDLAKLCGILGDFQRTDVAVEHIKAGKTRLLSEVKPTFTKKGSPSVRTIRVIEDGREKHYDGNYEFDVTALLMAGERLPVPEPK